MHLKRDYSGIGSSFGIMITIFEQSSFMRDCYASPKCLGFEFLFLEHKKNTRDFNKEYYNQRGFDNHIQKFGLSGFKRRGKSDYSFQVLIGFKENHKYILDSFKDRAINHNLIDTNLIEQLSKLKDMKVSLAETNLARLKITYLVDRHSSGIEQVYSHQTPSTILDTKTYSLYINDEIGRHDNNSKNDRKCNHERRYSNDILHMAIGRLSDSNTISKLPKSKHDIVVVHHIRNDLYYTL